ncbi:MAG: FHA domain-containing protein [Verrucomicrobiota bacterium]|nr:FHA domain-containing protein [Verrucomicrobiota bacterium]
MHLRVEQGPEKGLDLAVPSQGARLGRSSKNDIVLSDPLLSRHHCRFFFKLGEGLWAADLGSANQTMVNKQPVQEARLRVGDVVTLGDTTLRVISDAPGQDAGVVRSAPPVVDLGLSAKEKKESRALARLGRDQLLVVLCVVAALAAAIWIWRLYDRPARPLTRPQAPLASEASLLPLEIEYEKVEGSLENIFRYYLVLRADNTLAVQIDDLQSGRHLPAEEKKLTTNQVRELARYFDQSGFFSLREEYRGILPLGVLSLWDLSVTLGKRTHRTVVANRLEPEGFKEVRERIETFGRNELGLWAIQVPPERLKQMAGDAFLNARKLHDERAVKSDNLWKAVRNLKKCHADLKAIEPKPDFYPDSLTLLSDCQKELQERYDEINFQSSRALNVQDWQGAAQHLRMILDLIPDEQDARYQDARVKLLEVENRLQKQKRRYSFSRVLPAPFCAFLRPIPDFWEKLP